jgi:hypothetical protein
MSLNQTSTNNLDPQPNLVADWLSRFTSIPQADQTRENNDMESIFNLLTPDGPCDASKMTAIVNPEDSIVFIGLDNKGEHFMLPQQSLLLTSLTTSPHPKRPQESTKKSRPTKPTSPAKQRTTQEARSQGMRSSTPRTTLPTTPRSEQPPLQPM